MDTITNTLSDMFSRATIDMKPIKLDFETNEIQAEVTAPDGRNYLITIKNI